MTWEELRKLIDDRLKEDGMDNSAELDYIDLHGIIYGDPEVYTDKDDNTFSVF